MTISALDKDTVRLLTTTQVITSISSAAKELIENALDANAKNIEINLTENGCALIEVKDNGCGISKDDAPCMALPSHTSKIFNFSDLESLQTYGFRGEALHALSSVSDLTVVSKTEQDEAALSYKIDHSGCIIKTEHCHRATGTTVQVRQLFKQIPVRRQIITNPKTASQDIKALESLIKSYGICKYFIQISYKVDNNIIFAKPSTATLEEAVTHVLGIRLTSNMNWLDITDAEMDMKLMVPSKKAQNILEVFQSGAQYIFVNNRPVKHKELEKVLSKIILEGVGLETSSRKKPIFLLYILTNAANIDVNLEPNKTSILFKQKNIVIDTIERHVGNFYDIRKEEAQQDGSCDYSFADYQDYTQKSVNNLEDEQPACKKRKCQAKEDIVTIETETNGNEIVTDSLNSAECNIKRVEEPQTCTSGQHYQDECSNNSERDFQVPPINLSETDSNDSQKCKLVFDDKVELHTTLKETTEENTTDSPPFELSPLSEKFSQLPIVDLGDDIPWDTFVNINTDEKENSHRGYNLDTKRPITVTEWSKGHASGLKGGTDVQACNYGAPNELSINDVHGPVCEGFLQFSKRYRSKVTEKNPAMTAPQIAHAITNLWKRLSPEERGYYRDLARDEKSERDVAKQDAKRIHRLDINKNKNRLLNALQKVKTMNLEKQQNLVMRTTVPWDIDLMKVTDCFLNNSPCENTNSVIGPLCSNLWIVHRSAHLWILDARNLQKEFIASDAHTNMENAENVELLLQRWFSTRNDMSLLHPIHSLTDKL